MGKGGQSDDDSEWTSLCSFRKRNMLSIKIMLETDQNTANRLALLGRWNRLKYFYCYHWLELTTIYISYVRKLCRAERRNHTHWGPLGHSYLFLFFLIFQWADFRLLLVKIHFSYICPVLFSKNNSVYIGILFSAFHLFWIAFISCSFPFYFYIILWNFLISCLPFIVLT